MDLSEFISEHREALIQAWASYALTICPKDTRLSEKQLRNSAGDILAAISGDMRIPQSPAEQAANRAGKEWSRNPSLTAWRGSTRKIACHMGSALTTSLPNSGRFGPRCYGTGRQRPLAAQLRFSK